nr:2-oxoacid:acceptor oxidoreductase subunit alpha [uncultured Holophaga sp.]
MNYNILIGGSAGQGMETLSVLLERALKRAGYHVHTTHDYMSRVRGGHNFTQIRFSPTPIHAACPALTGMVALNADTVALHRERLVPGGFILLDASLSLQTPEPLARPFQQVARELGGAQAAGSVALGALLRLFGMEPALLRDILQEHFGSEPLVELNYRAALAGFAMVETRYPLLPPKGDPLHQLNGNEAIALGALAAGLRFYSAYPMTPSTSVMDFLAANMAEAGIIVEQAEDEIAAINMAIGASFAGVRAMTGTSGGGFCLQVEALGLAGILELPLVVLNVQRPGPATGLPTRTEQADLQFVIHAAQGEFPRMVIAVRDVEDAYRQTQRAFDLADRFQIPVILLSDQYLADTRRTVPPLPLTVADGPRFLGEASNLEPFTYRRYALTPDGVSPRLIPGKNPGQVQCVDSDEHDEWGHIVESAEDRKAMADKRFRKSEGIRSALEEPLFLGSEAADILLLAWGSLCGPVREALDLLASRGIMASALVFGDIWPLPVGELERHMPRALHRLNVEQNATGQLAALIRQSTGQGVTGSILKYDGRQLTPQDIADAVQKEVGLHA